MKASAAQPLLALTCYHQLNAKHTMKYPKIYLKTSHCEEVLNQELLIGADSKREKKFTFHVWMNEYRVYSKGECIDSGQAVEELLEVYNSL